MKLQPYTVCDGDLIHVTVMAISEEDAIAKACDYANIEMPDDYHWEPEWLWIDQDNEYED